MKIFLLAECTRNKNINNFTKFDNQLFANTLLIANKWWVNFLYRRNSQTDQQPFFFQSPEYGCKHL